MAAEKPETMHLSPSIPLLYPQATCSRYLRPPGGNLSPRACPAQMGDPERVPGLRTLASLPHPNQHCQGQPQRA